MMNNHISIIIPIFNIAPYLDRCINSVCAQTYRNLQIILVDDGSTDGSSEICDRYAGMDARITVIHKENGGLVSARKAGLRAATGEYVAYVDGDDWVEPELYERMMEEMRDVTVDLVETDSFMDMGNASIPMKSKISYGKLEADNIIPIMLCDEAHNECRLKPHVWSKLFKRNLLKKVQFAVDNCITIGEDAAVTYPYILHCKKVSVLNYAGYHYVQHKDSMLREGKELPFDKTNALISGLKEHFMPDNRKELLLPQLNEYAKLLMLNKHMDRLDSWMGGGCLMPYGGVEKTDRVIIYGAGNVGQSIYRYLKKSGIPITTWLDREYAKYRELGMGVSDPKTLPVLEGEYDIVIIAVNSKAVADAIKESLHKQGIAETTMRWLTDEFIQMDILDDYLSLE